MVDKSKTDHEAESAGPRVIADFGGRRKVLDRRSGRIAKKHTERRSGKDRRSGFDRRGALTQNGKKKTEKRHEFKKIEQLSEKLNNGVE